MGLLISFHIEIGALFCREPLKNSVGLRIVPPMGQGMRYLYTSSYPSSVEGSPRWASSLVLLACEEWKQSMAF